MNADQLIKYLGDKPGQVVLTLVVVLVALVAGPFLARRSSRVPALMEAARERNGQAMLDTPETTETAEATEAAAAAQAARRRRNGSDIGAKWLGRITLLSVWIAALFAIGLIWFTDITSNPAQQKNLEDAARRIATNLGASLVVLALTLVIAQLMQRTISENLLRGRMNINLVQLAARSAYVLVLIFGLIVILAIWDIGLILSVAFASVLSLALSLALQDVLKNLVSGIYLLVERPFMIGDQINIEPYSGLVEDIQMRVTVLRTVDDRRVLVPNALLFMSPVINQTYYSRRRAMLTVSMASDAIKTDDVELRIQQALHAVPDIIQTDPAPETILSGASDGKVTLRVAFWIPTMAPLRQASVISDAIAQLRAQLPGAEIVSASSV